MQAVIAFAFSATFGQNRSKLRPEAGGWGHHARAYRPQAAGDHLVERIASPASGANLNRLFGVNSSQPEVCAIEDWLHAQGQRFPMTFDLHEVPPDYVGEGFVQKDNPRAAYLYETVNDDSERVGRLMINALPSTRPVCDWPTIYDDINQAGVISYPEGGRNKIYAEGTSFDSFLSRRYTGHSFTLETPTGWSLSDRVDTHLTFLKTALRSLVAKSSEPTRDRAFRPQLRGRL